MDNIRTFSAPAKAGDGKSIGIAAYSGDKVNLGHGVEVIDLSGLTSAPTVPVLMEHDRSLRVGVADSIVNDGFSLHIGARSLDTGAGTEFRELASQGFPWQASVGASFTKFTRVEAGDDVQVNGRTFTGPITVLSEGVLREVSVVSVGADADTSARAFAQSKAEVGETSLKENQMDEPKGATVGELKAAFPGESDFILDQVEKGATVDSAKAEFAGVLSVRLAASEAKNVQLSESLATSEARFAGSSDGVGHSEPVVEASAQAPVFLNDDEKHEHEWKTGTEDLRAEFMGDFKLFAAYQRAEAKGLVRIQGKG